MQSAAIAFSSPSLSLSAGPGKLTAAHRFNARFLLPHSERPRFGNVTSTAFSSSLSTPISCSMRRGGWFFSSNPVPESDLVPVRATAESADAAEVPQSKSMSDTLVLGTLFGLWYLFNIYFNIYNKQVLKVFPYPVTVSLVQFAVGTVIVFLMWTLNIYKRPAISGSQLVAILPLAVVHTLGNLFTNMSLGKVAVSFTHTIKAMEPFFSVILSAMFLGEFPTVWVTFSLLPIVGGVGLASMTEASFNWAGFWSAMASSLTNQSRNVLSKKFLVKKEESLDNITLFSVITIMSFIMMIPTAIFMEGIKFTPPYLHAAVSYMILQGASHVTHSVGNCVKRVVVIVSSVIFFGTAVSPVNTFGTGIALAGVFPILQSEAHQTKAKGGLKVLLVKLRTCWQFCDRFEVVTAEIFLPQSSTLNFTGFLKLLSFGLSFTGWLDSLTDLCSSTASFKCGLGIDPEHYFSLSRSKFDLVYFWERNCYSNVCDNVLSK